MPQAGNSRFAMTWRQGGIAFVSLVALAALPTTLLRAQTAPPSEDCARAAWPLAEERAALAARPLAELRSGATLPWPGDAVSLALSPLAGAELPRPPGRPADPNAGAGFLRFDVDGPERLWQITLDAPAWVDVIVDGRVLDPVAFTGVHACPGLRKSLRFRIPPGSGLLQISGGGDRVGIVVRPVGRH